MDFDDLLDKIRHLHSILSTPDRPFYQVEIAHILYEISSVLESWDDDICLLNAQVSKQKADIERLESRYSELQYKVAEIMQASKAS